MSNSNAGMAFTYPNLAFSVPLADRYELKSWVVYQFEFS